MHRPGVFRWYQGKLTLNHDRPKLTKADIKNLTWTLQEKV
jgi:hypothetical protein